MSINDFAEMTILLCLIYFSIYAKIHPAWKKSEENAFLRVPDDSVYTQWAKKFLWNCSISHCFRDECIFAIYSEIHWKMIFAKKWQMSLCILWG